MQLSISYYLNDIIQLDRENLTRYRGFVMWPIVSPPVYGTYM